MSLSIAEAQRLGLIPTPEKHTSKPYVHPLTKRLMPICSHYGWHVDVYRTFCTLPESPQNDAGTTAKPNGVVVWQDAGRVRVAHLGWIWDVCKWNEAEVVARLREIEVQL